MTVRFIGFALTASIFAQTPQSTGVLTVKVVNSVTGEPVRKAAVQIQPNGRMQGPMPPNAGGVTDTQGRAIFRQMPAGIWSAWVEHPAYPRAEGRSYSNSITTLEQGSEKELIVKLDPGGSISGKVTDEEGEPLRAGVSAWQQSFGAVSPTMRTIGSAATDESGEFRINDLPPGRYYVQVRPLRNAPQPHPLMRAAEVAKLPATTYPSLFFPNLPSAEGATLVSVPSGGNAPGIDFRVAPVGAVSVSGRYVLPPPLTAVSQQPFIQLHPIGSDGLPVTYSVSQQLSGRANQDRSFVIPKVPAGQYLLTFTTEIEKRSVYGSQPLAVAATAVTDVVLSLKVANDLPIALVKEEARQGVTTNPPPPPPSGQQLWINPSGPRPYLGHTRIEALPDGSMVLRNLTPGSYYLRPTGGYIKSVKLGGREIGASIVEFTGNESGTLEVVVSSRHADVRVSVAGMQNDKTASVVFSNLDPRFGLDFQSYQVNSTSGEVRATLPPGEYKVLCIEGDPSRLRNSGMREWIGRGGTSVSATTESATSVSVSVIPSDTVDRAVKEALDKAPN